MNKRRKSFTLAQRPTPLLRVLSSPIQTAREFLTSALASVKNWSNRATKTIMHATRKALHRFLVVAQRVVRWLSNVISIIGVSTWRLLRSARDYVVALLERALVRARQLERRLA